MKIVKFFAAILWLVYFPFQVSYADTDPQILTDFKSALALMEQYDYGESHAWLKEFQKSMIEVYNHEDLYAEAEQLMIEALKSEASFAAKQMICAYLGPIATESAVAPLESMVLSEDLSAPVLSVFQQIPGNAVDKALIRQLSAADGPRKSEIIQVLGIRKAPETVKPLKKLVFAEDPVVSHAAVYALGKIGTQASGAVLQKAFGKSGTELKWEVADAWMLCADQILPADPQAACNIYETMREETPPGSLYYAALKGILSCNPDHAESLIMEKLAGDDAEIQTLIIPLIGYLDRETDLKPYLEYLSELGGDQQIQLMAVLSQRKYPGVKPYLIRTIEQQDTEFHLPALKALQELAGAEEAIFLAETAAKSRGRIRDMARECLEMTRGDDFDQELLKGFHHPDPLVRVECIRSTGERNMKSAVEPVLASLQDPDRRVRIESYKVLGKLAGPEYMAEILKAAVKAGSNAERNEAERTITQVALKIPHIDKRADDILGLLPDIEDESVLVMFIQALGNIGSPQALPALREYLKNEQMDIRVAAVKAMSEWPDDSPVDDLREIIEAAEDIKLHNLATRGYVRLVQLSDKMTEDEKFEALVFALQEAGSLEEKKIVVSGLSALRSKDAFQMAIELLSEQDLQAEAKGAISTMAGPLGNRYPVYTREEVQKLIQSTNDPEFKARLEEILKWMD